MPCLAGALVAVARDEPVGGIIVAIASNRWASGPGDEPRSRRASREASWTLRSYQSVGGEHRMWLSGRSHCLAGRMASVLNPMNGPQGSGWAGASPAWPVEWRQARSRSCRKLSLYGTAGHRPRSLIGGACAQVRISPCPTAPLGVAWQLLCDACPCGNFVRQCSAPARSPHPQAWDNRPASLRGEAAGMQRQAPRGGPSEGA